MSEVKSPVVLNLAGELSPELVTYFAQKGIKLLDPKVDEFTFDVKFILTKDLHDFKLLDDTYDTINGDVKIISLTPVLDLPNFIFHNGKLILNNEWLQGSFGEFILDKFFLSTGGITIGENYPTFTEEGGFKVINPFNTGEYLDQLTHKAFEAGMSALSIKTYFDHLLMYLTGLRTKGKAAFPIEVTYGSFKDTYGVQLHFFANDLKLEDVTLAVSNHISKRAEEYLLNVAIQSCDFFDFSYLQDVKKVVVTGIWTKDERIQIENRGIMFTNLNATRSLSQFSSTDTTSLFTTNESELIDDPGRVILASPTEAEAVSVVSGSEGESDVSQLVKGSKDLEELVTRLSGTVSEEMDVIKVQGEKKDIDSFVVKLSNAIEDKGQGDMRVRSLGSSLPSSIKTGLFDFAKGMGKQVDDLDNSDLSLFENKNLPQIVRKVIESTVIKGDGAPAKETAPLFKVQPTDKEKGLEAKVSSLEKENELLKNKVKGLGLEMKTLRDNQARINELKVKAASAQLEKPSVVDDIMKLGGERPSEREVKLGEELRQFEKQLKKAQIEAAQKESYLSKELETQNRLGISKDLMISKTKETFQKALESKTKELEAYRMKMDQVTKQLANQSSSTQATAIRDLEKQNQNLTKMNEVYKEKISGLIGSMESKKNDGGSSKEELRKAQMVIAQNKNYIETMKKEVSKLQDKASLESSKVISLSQEKVKLEQLLKKTMLASTSKDPEVTSSVSEADHKKVLAQVTTLETQLKESTTKVKELELKLQETLKIKTTASPEDNSAKVKISHLETSQKKLTQDLVEARNAVSEMKKDVNKLRQEKTALQNQLDKIKKDADKTKAAAPKKPNGGKAA